MKLDDEQIRIARRYAESWMILHKHVEFGQGNMSVDISRALVQLHDEVQRLNRIIQDAAPMMMTVTAFGADEADRDGLAEMAHWYTRQERDYSSFDVWFEAHLAREKSRSQ